MTGRDGKPEPERRSPLLYAAEISASVLLIHSAEDKFVPLAQAQEMYEAIRSAGGVATLHVMRDKQDINRYAGHGFTGGGRVAAWRETLGFFAALLDSGK